jgi:hypothetical protein
VATTQRDLDILLARLRDIEVTLANVSEFREAAETLQSIRKELAGLSPVQALVAQLALPPPQMAEAAERLLAMARSQAAHSAEARDRLLDVLMADLEVLDPVPHASVSQARRVAETRNRLLAGGAWTVSALADARDSSRSAVHTWLARQRAANHLISVTVRGDTYVPALLLDEAAEPFPNVSTVLGPLRQAGMNPWAVWVWLDSPSAWLDGDRPASLLAKDETGRAALAAQAQAANSAAPSAETDAA